MEKIVKESRRAPAVTKEVSYLFNSNCKSLLEYIPDYIAVYDTKGNYQYLNHYAKGFSKKETIGKHYTTYLTDKSAKIYKACFNKAVKTKSTQYIQYSALGDEGAERFYESFVVPIFKQGKFVNMMVVARDITQKRELEKALLTSEINTRAVMESISDVLIVIDKDGNIIDTNEGNAKRFNLKRKDIVGKNLKDILPKDLFNQRMKNIRKTITTGKPVFGEDIRNNLVTEFSIYPVTIDNSVPDKVVVFARDITDKKKLLYKIKKNQKQSSLILNTQKVVFYSAGLDRNFSTKWISDKIESLTGFQESDFINDKNFWNSRLHPDDKKQALKTYANVLKYEYCEMEYRWKCADNKYKWFFEKISLIKGDNGKPCEIIGIWMDINDRKNSEEELRYSEEKYRTLIDTMSEGLLILDNKDVIQFANKSCCKMYGYELDEILGKTGYRTLLHKDYKELVLKKNKERIEGLTDSYEVKGIKKSGEIIWVKICGTPFRDKSGNVIGSIGILSDITEQKKAVEVLKDNEQKQADMISNLPGFVYRCANDKNWTMYYISDGCMNITGYNPKDFIRNNKLAYNDIIPKDYQKTLWNKWQIIIKNKSVFESEYPIVTANGEIKWVWERGRGIFSDKNKLLYLEGFITDFTERKKYEEKLNENFTLLRIAGKTAKFGGWSVNLSDELVTWSEEVRLIHEIPHEYSPSVKEGINFYAEDFKEKITKVYTDCAVNGVPYDEEMKIITAKGNTRWVRTTGEPIHDSEGNIVKVQGSFQDITDKKTSEQILKESEQLLRLLFDNNPNALFLISNDGKFNNVNKHAVKRYGYSLEEFQKMTPADIAAPEYRDNALNRVKKALGEELQFEWAHCKKNGEVFPVEIYTKPIKINEKPFIFVEARDLTKQKIAEHSIKISEEKFRKSFHSNPGIVGISSLNDGRYIEVNDNFYKSMGFAKDEVIGKTSKELNVFADFNDRKIMLKLLNDYGKIDNLEIKIRKKNGEYLDTILSAELIEMNEQKCLLTQILDITERKKNEESLKINEELYHSLFEKVSAVKLLIDPHDGKIIDANSAAVRYYGYSLEELKSIKISDINTLPPDKIQMEMEKAHFDKQSYFNFKHKLANGDIRDVEVYSSPVEINGKLLLHSIVHDITERKSAEELLIKSEERLRELNAAKDKFFNIIAHDLRSPFSSILGFSNLLEEQMKEKNYDGIEEYAGYIQKSSKHAMSLLTNLLDWSRSQTGKMEFKPEYTDLKILIDEVLILANDSAKQKSIVLERDFGNNVPIIADKTMIGIILRNLISNAVKFTNTGGKVVVSAQQKPDELLISVKDNGIGMTFDSLNNLFRIDINHTTLGTEKEKGTGLGLLLCKEFVDKHEGKIWVESEVGKGSTFYFSLPKD